MANHLAMLTMHYPTQCVAMCSVQTPQPNRHMSFTRVVAIHEPNSGRDESTTVRDFHVGWSRPSIDSPLLGQSDATTTAALPLPKPTENKPMKTEIVIWHWTACRMMPSTKQAATLPHVLQNEQSNIKTKNKQCPRPPPMSMTNHRARPNEQTLTRRNQQQRVNTTNPPTPPQQQISKQQNCTGLKCTMHHQNSPRSNDGPNADNNAQSTYNTLSNTTGHACNLSGVQIQPNNCGNTRHNTRPIGNSRRIKHLLPVHSAQGRVATHNAEHLNEHHHQHVNTWLPHTVPEPMNTITMRRSNAWRKDP